MGGSDEKAMHGNVEEAIARMYADTATHDPKTLEPLSPARDANSARCEQ